MNWIDIVVIIILLLTVFNGFRRGLFLSVFGFVKIILAFILAKNYHQVFTDQVLMNFNIKNSFNSGIHSMVTSSVDPNQFVENPSSDYVSQTIESLNLPNALSNSIQNNLSGIDMSSYDSFTNGITNYISGMILYALGFIVLLILMLLLLSIVEKLLSIIFDLPVIRTVNKLGGIIFGLLAGVIFIDIFMALIYILHSGGMVEPIYHDVVTSKVSVYFYDYNILLYVINNYFMR